MTSKHQYHTNTRTPLKHAEAYPATCGQTQTSTLPFTGTSEVGVKKGIAVDPNVMNKVVAQLYMLGGGRDMRTTPHSLSVSLCRRHHPSASPARSATAHSTTPNGRTTPLPARSSRKSPATLATAVGRHGCACGQLSSGRTRAAEIISHAVPRNKYFAAVQNDHIVQNGNSLGSGHHALHSEEPSRPHKNVETGRQDAVQALNAFPQGLLQAVVHLPLTIVGPQTRKWAAKIGWWG